MNRTLVRAALTCQHAAETVDLGFSGRGLLYRLRFWLHLSLCQACKNYYTFSSKLSNHYNRGPRQKPGPQSQFHPSDSLQARLMREMTKRKGD